MIRAFFVTVITFAYIFIVGTPALIHAVLVRDTRRLYRVGVWGAKLAVWMAGVRVIVRGREKVPKDRAVVFMSNHLSNADGPMLAGILPPVLIIAKKEFFKIPVLGRAMLMHGFIPVDRKNREKAIEAVKAATKALKAGSSLLVFPEGTRSADGRLQRFKKGVFFMAIEAAAPIVPISVSGSRKITRKGELAMHPGVVHITFHDPVPTAGRTLADRGRIMTSVRQAIVADLAEDEKPLEPENKSSVKT